MAAADAAFDETKDERLSLPKFGIWKAQGDSRCGYWPTLVFSDEKGLKLGGDTLENGLCGLDDGISCGMKIL